ncbi:MAG: mannitol dehydrogenase family protein [Alphaproteobacteria bacterium]|nr:mannitol dehydrogenase family protein [Alphaproteobacteria bacterium]
MPSYDRHRVTPSIVHLGVGAFHRAHQAVYIDDCLGEDPNWAITGASLRNRATRDALAPQDCLYTVAVRHGSKTELRVIGSIKELLHCPGDNKPIIDRIASPETRVVTLTVTEKAYCHNPATGDLDMQHADIAADLRQPRNPRSVPGLLVAALAERRAKKLPPVSIVSCDNLPANGATLAHVVRRFAERTDPALAQWIASEISFPSTMVDRIVPATTDADRMEIAELAGYDDAWPVVTEPFSQWVVEDRFVAGRPPLENAGVLMAADVEPFELMKLRLLNGSHSALAYLGVQAEFDTVSDAVADAQIRQFLEAMMCREIMPTLQVPGVDLNAYVASLLNRFANTALNHRTMQIAMDGSQKIPQRILGTIRECRRTNRTHDRLILAVAAWIRHLAGKTANGQVYVVEDPQARYFGEVAATTLPDVNAFGAAILDIESVFGRDLSSDESFRSRVLSQLRILFESGPAAALAMFEN